jgi:excinuclease ABC subunit A
MKTAVPTKTSEIDQFDPREYIVIRGARVNNLKNLSVAIPRNRFVVITGLSGSGKSSLAFDTLFAEGQRMYVESLSSYARQFLGRMEKPEVDYIRGVSPAIAIEQKANTRNPRSTVGTATEIYDYLKLLYARAGTTYSPVSGDVVRKDSVEDVVDYILDAGEGTRGVIMCPLKFMEKRSFRDELKILMSKGYMRVKYKDRICGIEEILDDNDAEEAPVWIVIDRIQVRRDDEDTVFRISDSVQTAFFEGHGNCTVEMEGAEPCSFSDRFELDGMQFEEPSVNFFSFNNPYGACRKCEGFGKILGIDPDLVIPDRGLSVYDKAVAPWRGPTMGKWLDKLLANAHYFDFPIHRPYKDLTEDQKALLWDGNKYFRGIDAFFRHLESKTHKIQYRVMLSRYRGRTVCPDCKGTRLRPDASYVRFRGKSIIDLVLMPVGEAHAFFSDMSLGDREKKLAGRILTEITNRLFYLNQVGLPYLTLNRLTASLSGGEYQRIKLATSLGSALVGSMYILDEPSIGLHPRDTQRLMDVLTRLRNLGNSVIVVEHDEDIIRAADQVIDIGPEAGSGGGRLVFQGRVEDMAAHTDSHTADYITGREKIDIPARRRAWRYSLDIAGARENNLKSIDVSIPLGVLAVITGVSGSGKSTLVKQILYPALGRMLGVSGESPGKFDGLHGDVDKISGVEYVDQNPIGKSSRSNPVTYLKAYDPIRALYAQQPISVQKGFKPAFFSFNVDGGRCEHCQGEGVVKIEMQFMADIYLTCEHCKGRRFKEEILEVQYHDKDISEVLELTVDDAMEFFSDHQGIVSKLKPLQDVGLGYVRLGQSSNTLSGGEAQRVKLAYYLSRGQSDQNTSMLFIFDEPTTGLHFHDIDKLLRSLNALIDQGNSVVIIEHNMEVAKSADWIIDLGPEGGAGGGEVVFSGIPEDMLTLEGNHTARHLKLRLQDAY